MQIDFTGHAGFWLQLEEIQIVVDPWLIASSLEAPLMDSLMPDIKTIDYLIPEPVHNLSMIAPDYILLSHFHTHHAPKKEIDHWLKNATKPVTVIGPAPLKKKPNDLLETWQNQYPDHKFILISEDSKFEVNKDISIEALGHTTNEHLAYMIRSKEKSFLHLADSIVSKVWHDRRLDLLWQKFKNMNPDLLAITVSSTAYRGKTKDGISYIRENGFMSPVEAAQLTNLINPKNVTVMGIYNFSVWKNRVEFGYSCYEVEAFFRWSIQHLRPDIAVHMVRPGYRFLLNQDSFYLTVPSSAGHA